MPLIWLGEGYDYPPDAQSGCRVARLTTTLKHHINVYCEHAYSSPNGTRIAILRSDCADPRIPPFDLLVADIERLRISVIEKDVASYLVATASWSGWIYYVSRDNILMRANLETLEKEEVWSPWPFSPDFILHTMSPDLRYMVGQLQQENYQTALVRLDLMHRTWKIIYEDPEISNAHPLYNPIHGRDISVMKATGFKVNDRQDVIQLPGPRRVTHFFIDNEGGNYRELPFGEPHYPNSCGHSNWIGDTGRLASVAAFDYNTWKLDSRWPEGNLFTAAPGDEQPTQFRAPEHRFNHIAVSKCGRYFVCDSYLNGIPGAIPLVVGNFETGKYRNLLGDCRATGGASACSHPHAYFTVDNRHVIFNADPTMIGHVYIARVPEGFLESLD